jgi:F0F1-type ATP synthase assembly protein I
LAAKLQILGWILFIISACAFIVSSLRSGDMPGLIGGIVFLLACFVFLIPYALREDRSTRS